MLLPPSPASWSMDDADDELRAQAYIFEAPICLRVVYAFRSFNQRLSAH